MGQRYEEKGYEKFYGRREGKGREEMDLAPPPLLWGPPTQADPQWRR